MVKTGIRRISFAEQNEVDDEWHQEEPPQRGDLHPLHWFSRFDQGSAALSESQVDNEAGLMFQASISFVVRTELDVETARKYAGRPVVMYLEAVDGKKYELGTKDYPVRMLIDKIYDGVRVRETSVSATFDTVAGIM